MALDAGLYLIPSQLSDGPLDRVLPAYNIEVVGEISYFVVESLRSARRFLKKCNRDIDIDRLTFSELNEHSDLKDTAALQRERDDAVRRSRAVLGGQFGEQLAPWLPDFPSNPGDVRSIAKPVDYIAFPGTAEGKPVREIVLIEVKSGASTLSPREKEIRAAVRAGRVSWVEYRLPDFDR